MTPSPADRPERRFARPLRRILWALGAALAYSAATLFALAPSGRSLAAVWRDHLLGGAGDSLLNLYFLKWSARQWTLGLPAPWDANFFFPLQGALALSDHLFGPALALLGLRPFVPNDIAGANVLALSSFVTLALATAWVVRQSGRSRWAALLAGGLLAFCPFRLSQISHLQILLAATVPLVLWHFDRLLAEPTPRRAAVFVGFYLLHLSGGCYLAYMVHVPLAAILAVRIGSVEFRSVGWAARSRAVLASAAILCALGIALVFAPYAQISHRLGLERRSSEVVRLSAALPSYVSPSEHSPYFSRETRRRLARAAPALERALTRSENALFPGFTLTALGVIGLTAGVVAPRRERRGGIRGGANARFGRLASGAALALAAWAWWLAEVRTLGTARGGAPGSDRFWWGIALVLAAGAIAARFPWGRSPGESRRAESNRVPSPTSSPTSGGSPWERGVAWGALAAFALSFAWAYVPAMRLLPGLAGMRVPARFGFFVACGLALFAARGADALADRFGRFDRIGRFGRFGRFGLWVGLFALAALESRPRAVPWVRILDEPEFPPIYRAVANDRSVHALVEFPLTRSPRETALLYYSTVHWKPIVNGYSGYEPAEFLALAMRTPNLPDAAALDRLARIGVSHVIVHGGHAKLRRRQAALERWEAEHVGSGPRARLERIRTEADGDRLYAFLGHRARAAPLASPSGGP